MPQLQQSNFHSNLLSLRTHNWRARQEKRTGGGGPYGVQMRHGSKGAEKIYEEKETSRDLLQRS